MKKLILLSLCMASLSLQGQVFQKFVDSHIRPSSSTQKPGISIETYPHFWLSGGQAYIVSFEWNRLSVGGMYWDVPIGAAIRDAVFQGASETEVFNNGAAELFVNLYLRKDRKGFYVGMLGGPEWFDVRENESGLETRIDKPFLVLPRLGFRWFLWKEILYMDSGYGLAHALGKIESTQLGDQTLTPNPRLGIPFFSLGARWIF
ncbi:MAG: hypothetical protein AAFY71_01095 [Bacteroidota bacterium]